MLSILVRGYGSKQIRHAYNYNWSDAENVQNPHRTNFLISRIFFNFIISKSKITDENLFDFAQQCTEQFKGLSERFSLLAQYINEEINPLLTKSAVASAYNQSLKKSQGDALIYVVAVTKIQPEINIDVLRGFIKKAIEANVTSIAKVAIDFLRHKLTQEQKEEIALLAALKGNFDAFKYHINKASDTYGSELISKLTKRKDSIEDSDFWYELGLIIEKKGPLAAAKTAFLEAVKYATPPSVPLLFSLAKIHSHDREYDQAAELLMKIHSMTKGHLNGIVYYYLAYVNKELNKFPEACKNIQQALKLEGEFAKGEFFLLASEIEAQVGDQNIANEYLKKMFEAEKTNLLFTEKWARAGQIYVTLQQWKEADDCYDNIKKQKESDLTSQMWWNFALCKQHLQNLVLADDYYTKAIEGWCWHPVAIQPVPVPQNAGNPPAVMPANPHRYLNHFQQALTPILQPFGLLSQASQAINNMLWQRFSQPAPQQVIPVPPVPAQPQVPAVVQPGPRNYSKVPAALLYEAASIKMHFKEWKEAEQYLQTLKDQPSSTYAGALFDVMFEQKKWQEAFDYLYGFMCLNKKNKTMDFNPLMKRLVIACQWSNNWNDLLGLCQQLNLEPTFRALVVCRSSNEKSDQIVFDEKNGMITFDGSLHVANVPAWLYACAALAKANSGSKEEAKQLYQKAKACADQSCDLFDLPFEMHLLEKKLNLPTTSSYTITPEIFRKLPFHPLYSLAQVELADHDVEEATKLFLGIIEEFFSEIEIPSHAFCLDAAEAIHQSDMYNNLEDTSRDSLMPKFAIGGMYLQNIQRIHFYVALKKWGIDQQTLNLVTEYEFPKTWHAFLDWKEVDRWIGFSEIDSIKINSSNIAFWLNYFRYLLQAKIELKDFDTASKLFGKIEKMCEGFKDKFYQSHACMQGLIIHVLEMKYKLASDLYNRYTAEIKKNDYDVDLLSLQIHYLNDDLQSIQKTLERLRGDEKANWQKIMLYNGYGLLTEAEERLLMKEVLNPLKKRIQSKKINIGISHDVMLNGVGIVLEKFGEEYQITNG